MLQKEKTISLSGRSVIDNVEVARFNAQLGTNVDDTTSTNTVISNLEAYHKNVKQVRADSDEFQAYVRENEDSIFAEADMTDEKQK